MRHAKSDWSADHGADHDRPLNDRGVRSARVIGRALTDASHAPDLVVTSSAVRARATAELASTAGGWESQIVIDSRLYGSGADAIVGVAAEVPDVESLMLVGHQPTWSILVSVLTGERIDMKTATVAVVELAIGAWAELPGQQGSLISVFQPRDYLE